MTKHIPHPREFIPETVGADLNNFAYYSERKKTLHTRQLAAIRGQNWFNQFVPKRLGGLELTLPEIIRIEEGIAWADGSSGWVVTLCSGAAWFVGFLDRELATDVLKSNHVCFAGSGAISGIANRSRDGYEVNGVWQYATGSLLATVFTVNCVVQNNGLPVYAADGKPMVKSFLLMADEVKIHRTWKAMGLVATGSHSIEAKKVQVPENRSFIIDPGHATLPDPIFHYPFLQLAESTLTVNVSGMALKFMDLTDDKLSRKNKDLYVSIINESRIRLEEARKAFYESVDASWNSLLSGFSIPGASLMNVTESSHCLVNCSADIVTTLYAHCGLEAADTSQEINRVWRNFHTAVQHSLFRNRLKLEFAGH
jgi:indole-3-acetate monooxygenase